MAKRLLSSSADARVGSAAAKTGAPTTLRWIAPPDGRCAVSHVTRSGRASAEAANLADTERPLISSKSNSRSCRLKHRNRRNGTQSDGPRTAPTVAERRGAHRGNPGLLGSRASLIHQGDCVALDEQAPEIECYQRASPGERGLVGVEVHGRVELSVHCIEGQRADLSIMRVSGLNDVPEKPGRGRARLRNYSRVLPKR
ncbi:hypothetical protein [Burkholderia gladioli]|uniref:hypothetical protein n=1 Tax=Burkholderia gladioli TaxID=28095 RepID=UPI00163FD185|nr:hypothetical protein [Burkholderia gladioli]